MIVMREYNPVNNLNDKEVVARTFIFGSMMSIITAKNLKGYSILNQFVKNKKVLQLYQNTIEVKDQRRAVMEYVRIVDVKKKFS